MNQVDTFTRIHEIHRKHNSSKAQFIEKHNSQKKNVDSPKTIIYRKHNSPKYQFTASTIHRKHNSPKAQLIQNDNSQKIHSHFQLYL